MNRFHLKRHHFSVATPMVVPRLAKVTRHVFQPPSSTPVQTVVCQACRRGMSEGIHVFRAIST